MINDVNEKIAQFSIQFEHFNEIQSCSISDNTIIEYKTLFVNFCLFVMISE